MFHIAEQIDSDPYSFWGLQENKKGACFHNENLIPDGIHLIDKTNENNEGQSRISKQLSKVVKQFDSDPHLFLRQLSLNDAQ